MNALKLADDLNNANGFQYIAQLGLASQAATMLRQQQAEIEALKVAKIRAYNNGVEDGRKPDTNNKPVAWINRKGKDGEHGYLEWDKDDKAEINTPLYTHPSEHDLGIAEAIGFEKGHKSAEDMLRQQQAEIEALKIIIANLTRVNC